MKKHILGDRALYRRFFAVSIPLTIQMGITNFVSLLDNIMVGQIGTVPMSSVAIVNGLIFVFNLCVFGASSGAGIFTAQFFGNRDYEGIRYTFRFKFLICLALAFLGISVFLVGDEMLIGLYLTGEGDPAVAAGMMEHGLDYLHMMLWGFVPFSLGNTYASTLRETGETMVPMISGIVAMFVNLTLNYVLIFGHFGAPAMGVQGAALATVISRYVEFAILALWTHLHTEKNPYICGVYRSMHIPGKLLRGICVKGAPLMINEFLWASAMAFQTQCYSTCGLDVVPAMNISSTLHNLGSVAFLSTGNGVGIIMGQMLGAGTEREEILDANRQLTFASILFGSLFAVLMAGCSGFFPHIYNTTDTVRHLATILILIQSVMLPFNSYTNATYFTLRSGGQTMVTFLFDSCFAWVFCVPLAFCLSRFTPITIIPLFAICQSTDFIKCVIGGYMIKKGKWIQNLTT